MRTAQSLCHSFIAVVATAGIGLGAGSSAIAAESTGSTAAASSVQSVVHAKSKRVQVKSVKLRDGSTAKVYKLGKNKMQAEIWAKGSKVGTLRANGKNAYANHNGLRVKLTCKGTVTSWMDSAKPKPKPKPRPHGKRVLVASPKLADGSTAKIYKLSASHYQADVFAAGAKLSSLDANRRVAYGENNGLHVALQPDGQLSSWLDTPGQDTQQPTPDTDDVKPDPQPTPDTDDIKPDPQPTPDSDDIKPQEQKPRPAADQAEPDAVSAPVPAT